MHQQSSNESRDSKPLTLAIAERGGFMSLTGEDFDVVDVNTRNTVFRVRGAMFHIPGKDKMKVVDCNTDQVCTVIERKLVAMTPTYDIYRGDDGNEKIGWMEKVKLSLTDTFDVHIHQKGEFRLGALMQPPPAYVVSGDFLNRRFVMKSMMGENGGQEVVAQVTKNGFFQFDEFNHYQVQVADGMDAALVVACVCAIDEEFDEEHKKRREQQ